MEHADRSLRRFYINKGMFGPLPLTFIFYRPPLVQFWYPSDYCAQRSVSFDKIFLVLSVFLGGVIFCFFARARVPSSGTFSSGEFYSKRKIIITSFAAAACVCDSESLGVRAAKIMIVIESLRFWFFLLVRFFFFYLFRTEKNGWRRACTKGNLARGEHHKYNRYNEFPLLIITLIFHCPMLDPCLPLRDFTNG